MTKRTVTKDFNKLQRSIFSFSNGEARVIGYDDELKNFQVELNIKDGYYKNAIFVFSILLPEKYPQEPPEVKFNSQIYHPNIGDGYDDDSVCLNLLNEDWLATNDLEDVVQGMLFLVKNPALDDPLNPLFCYDNFEEYEVQFTELVRKSLEGKEVEGVQFERNIGLIRQDENITNISEARQIEVDAESAEVNSTKDLALSPFCEITMNISSQENLCQRALFGVYNLVSFSENDMMYYNRACPKWLLKLAVSMFDVKKRKESVNIFSKLVQRYQRRQRFLFFSRALT